MKKQTPLGVFPIFHFLGTPKNWKKVTNLQSPPTVATFQPPNGIPRRNPLSPSNASDLKRRVEFTGGQLLGTRGNPHAKKNNEKPFKGP